MLESLGPRTRLSFHTSFISRPVRLFGGYASSNFKAELRLPSCSHFQWQRVPDPGQPLVGHGQGGRRPGAHLHIPSQQEDG